MIIDGSTCINFVAKKGVNNFLLSKILSISWFGCSVRFWVYHHGLVIFEISSESERENWTKWELNFKMLCTQYFLVWSKGERTQNHYMQLKYQLTSWISIELDASICALCLYMMAMQVNTTPTFGWVEPKSKQRTLCGKQKADKLLKKLKKAKTTNQSVLQP